MKFFGSRRMTFTEGYLPEKQTVKWLERKGTRDGVRGVDKQNSPTVTEREVVAQYDAAAQLEALAAQKSISIGVQNAQGLEPLLSEAEVKSVQAACSAQLKGIATPIRAKLAEQWGDVVDTRADLDQFRTVAGITDKAVYPESKISHYGSLFLIGIGEAAANSWFYGSASPDGLGAGLLQAAVVSTILVGSGAMAGSFAFRSCFSPNRIRRGFGLAGMAIYAAFALFISMAAASFRDALANDVNLDGLMLPISEILVSPAGLSFEAITLLAFALMASGLAVYKGLTSDAIVPGHGRLDRRYRLALARYKDTWSSATESVTQGREAAQARLDELRESVRNILEKRDRSASMAKTAACEYEATSALLQSGFDYTNKVYRDAVDVIDPMSKWPAALELDCPLLQTAGIEVAETAVTESRKRFEQVSELVAEASHALNDVAIKVQHELETFRAGVEATQMPGVPADSPKLRVVPEQMMIQGDG